MTKADKIKQRLNHIDRIIADLQKIIDNKQDTVSGLAKKAKVTRATIYNLLKGERISSAVTVNKIEEVINDNRNL